MRRPQLLLGLLLALPGAGCGVVSLHPLHSNDALVHDDNLEGTWAPAGVVPKDEGERTVDIGPYGKGQYTVGYRFDKGELHQRNVYLGHLMKLGSVHYLDLFLISVEEPTLVETGLLRTHRFVGVKVEKDALVFRYVDRDKFTQVLKKEGGGLNVEEVEGWLVVTSKTPALQAFFRKHGEEVLGKPQVFKRLARPAGKERREGKR
jgi:hypothetical protein